jgi:hypothetical protein
MLPQPVVVFEIMTGPSIHFGAGKAMTLPPEQEITDANPSRICLESFQIGGEDARRFRSDRDRRPAAKTTGL